MKLVSGLEHGGGGSYIFFDAAVFK